MNLDQPVIDKAIVSKAEYIQAIQDATDKWLTANYGIIERYLEWQAKRRDPALDKPENFV